jgi:hypothetical protein
LKDNKIAQMSIKIENSQQSDTLDLDEKSFQKFFQFLSDFKGLIDGQSKSSKFPFEDLNSKASINHSIPKKKNRVEKPVISQTSKNGNMRYDLLGNKISDDVQSDKIRVDVSYYDTDSESPEKKISFREKIDQRTKLHKNPGLKKDIALNLTKQRIMLNSDQKKQKERREELRKIIEEQILRKEEEKQKKIEEKAAKKRKFISKIKGIVERVNNQKEDFAQLVNKSHIPLKSRYSVIEDSILSIKKSVLSEIKKLDEGTNGNASQLKKKQKNIQIIIQTMTESVRLVEKTKKSQTASKKSRGLQAEPNHLEISKTNLLNSVESITQKVQMLRNTLKSELQKAQISIINNSELPTIAKGEPINNDKPEAIEDLSEEKVLISSNTVIEQISIPIPKLTSSKQSTPNKNLIKNALDEIKKIRKIRKSKT